MLLDHTTEDNSPSHACAGDFDGNGCEPPTLSHLHSAGPPAAFPQRPAARIAPAAPPQPASLPQRPRSAPAALPSRTASHAVLSLDLMLST